MSKLPIPPTKEIVSHQELVRRHPTILTKASVQWALRKRGTNGLGSAVYEARSGALLVHEPTFIHWFLKSKGHCALRAQQRERVADALPDTSSSPARAGTDAPRIEDHPMFAGNLASPRSRKIDQ
jgi:hypothetical protein